MVEKLFFRRFIDNAAVWAEAVEAVKAEIEKERANTAKKVAELAGHAEVRIEEPLKPPYPTSSFHPLPQ